MTGPRFKSFGREAADRRKLSKGERQEFKEKVKKLLLEGLPKTVIAERLGVSYVTLYTRLRSE